MVVYNSYPNGNLLNFVFPAIIIYQQVNIIITIAISRTTQCQLLVINDSYILSKKELLLLLVLKMSKNSDPYLFP